MNAFINKEVTGLVWNLKNGLRLLVFRKVPNEGFRVSLDQAVLLVACYFLVTFLLTFVQSLPDPEFSSFGIANLATHITLILFVSFISAKLLKTDTLKNFVIVFSVWPWFYLIWFVVGDGPNFSQWMLFEKENSLYLICQIWFLAVTTYALISQAQVNVGTIVKSIAPVIVFIFLPLHVVTLGEFWHQSYDVDEELLKLANINEEDTYYKQFNFIDDLRRTLLPQRKDVTDLYFVGFGSYASQDVFMKEVQYAQDLFDERFDTKGRSVALINNYKTIENTPLASKNNLGLVLEHIGQIIDPDEDVVFLYLTSHGSKQHKLSVDLMPLRLNTIGPNDLKQALDKSGIKWRVLLVSACYSGGFVEPLKDQYSVIMTASAPNKQSFGCGNKSEFTYFGKAIFEEELRHNFNFVDAFNNALVSIRKREEREKRNPSVPQLYIGEQIRSKLDGLSQDLHKFYTNTNIGVGPT
jgi:hypothetical protein